ncbi:hypothetical protein BDR26DRAFT_868580 [Obelidium mucronatum]|nr:hypothetical protein BDR26DRAFT_868580 [Obelidium mucronatum]
MQATLTPVCFPAPESQPSANEVRRLVARRVARFAFGAVDVGCEPLRGQPGVVFAVDNIVCAERRRVVRVAVPNDRLLGAGANTTTTCKHSALAWERCGTVGSSNSSYNNNYDDYKFAEGSTDHAIKDTSSVKPCRPCAGAGFKPCRECNASGKILCKFCDGDGFILKEEVEDRKKQQQQQQQQQIIKKTRIIKDANGKIRETEETIEQVLPAPNSDYNNNNNNNNKSQQQKKVLHLPCKHCKSTGNRFCWECDGKAKQTCETCKGHASVVEYLALRVSRFITHSTNWFYKPRNSVTGLYETVANSDNILSSKVKSSIATRVLWEGLEVDANEACHLSNGARTTATCLPDRIVAPTVIVPLDTGRDYDDVRASIAAIELDDVINDVVSLPLALGKRETENDSNSSSSSSSSLNLEECPPDKALARRVRIRQGVCYIVDCEYVSSSTSASFFSFTRRSDAEKCMFRVTLGLKNVGGTEYDTDVRTRSISNGDSQWEILEMSGYPMVRAYWRLGMWTFAGMLTVGTLWSFLAMAKRRIEQQ